MSVNHAMSIIHTIGKLPFVPDFGKKKSFEIFHSSLHLVENRSSSGVPMKPLIDLLICLIFVSRVEVGANDLSKHFKQDRHSVRMS